LVLADTAASETLLDVALCAAIEVRSLTKRYRNGVTGNDRISLSVAPGMVLGVLGPNGAGKTTLVRQVTGELDPTDGDVRVMGIDVLHDHTRARALMGVVPQEALPYDHLTPRQHLEFFARLRGLSRGAARRRAAEIIDALALGPHVRKMSRELSGGLKRKLLVGNAIVGDPPVLVLDEPTTGLDPHARREVWAVLRALRSRSRTIVITTHYMEEAEELCDEVVLISAGRIRARGTVEDLRAQCAARYKATYRNGDGLQAVSGQSAEDVLAELARLGVDEYALAKTTLEDVYMELAAQSLEA
jgi:ABC-type multidrug transport system ATPase subunit